MKTHTPIRKCVVTGVQLPKSELVRMACLTGKSRKKVLVDINHDLQGRGAYLHLSKDVLKKARKRNTLARHLKTEIPESLYDELEKMIEESNSEV